MNKLSMIRWGVLLLFVLFIAGCGGTGASSSATLSGVAAAGYPIVGTVYLKDSSVPAKELSVPIAADGSFSFNLNGLTAPYILKATGSANNSTWTLYSFATAAGLANINPLSTLAMHLANGGSDPENLYLSPDPLQMATVRNLLRNSIASVQTALGPTLAKFGAATVNFIEDPYIANHQGLDLLLDLFGISTGNGFVILEDRMANKSIGMSLNDFKAGSLDFVENPVTSPGALCILPGAATMATGSTWNFTAFVIGSKSRDFSWNVIESNGGSITSNGVYTAPNQAGNYHVKATSLTEPTKSNIALIEVYARPNTTTGSVSITPSGSGVYSVTGSNFANVEGVEVEIAYDPASLANPRITKGSLSANTMFLSNARYTASSIKIVFMSLTAIAGNGSLATISFDALGSDPIVPVILKLKIVSASGVTGGVVTGSGATGPAPNPPSPPASTSGPLPAASSQ